MSREGDQFFIDARGKWRSILVALGVDDKLLDGKGRPCPICKGGRDRFTFDDLDGEGTYVCRKCGAGKGLKLVMAIFGINGREAMKRARGVLGGAAPRAPSPRKEGREAAKKAAAVWNATEPITRDNPVGRYLEARGLGGIADLPRDLRYHPGLEYWTVEDDKPKLVGSFPAMVGLVRGADGKGVTVHRTYLTADGGKAPVPSPKKLLSAVEGGLLRLYPAEQGKPLAIAEGIETALAVRAIANLPVWSTISAGGMENFQPPAGIDSVYVFADNDASYTGQAAAFALAKRLVSRGLTVKVYTPRKVGTDWLDDFNSRLKTESTTAVDGGKILVRTP